MTQQVALVNSHGEIVSSFSYAAGEYTDGGTIQGNTIRVLDASVNVKEFRKTNYHNGDAWVTRSEQPGEFYVWASGAWSVDNARLQAEIRAERNRRLAASDWTQVPDSPLSDSDKTAWANHRQALRDFPAVNTATTWEDIVWPTQP